MLYESLTSCRLLIHPQNHYGWKRPLRPSSLTVNPSLPCSLTTDTVFCSVLATRTPASLGLPRSGSAPVVKSPGLALYQPVLISTSGGIFLVLHWCSIIQVHVFNWRIDPADIMSNEPRFGCHSIQIHRLCPRFTWTQIFNTTGTPCSYFEKKWQNKLLH